jgi:3-oxoacyl-[acyl-carrier-protein] synthase II
MTLRSGAGATAVNGRRVVVTGMGAVTPIGNDVATFWTNLVAGKSGVRRIEAFDPSRICSQVAGEVRDFDPSGVLDRKEQRRNDRFTQFALVTAAEALRDAGLPEHLEGALAERTGSIIGTGFGGSITIADGLQTFAERGPDRVSPFFVPMAIANLAAGQISIILGTKGPGFATVSACASGGHALGEAAETIRRGDADVMLAGGAEAPVAEAWTAAFCAMRALSTRNDDPETASRPFDMGRDGFVMAEGAAVLVLEALDHAEARGARIHAELVGYGASMDASHITLPSPGGEGAARAMRRAIEKAGLEPSDVAYVNAHATSTPEGDSAELQAIRSVLGDHTPRAAISANKSMLGHTLGAAGAIEAVATVKTITDGCAPPTINLSDPDPAGEGLDLVPGHAKSGRFDVALSNSFGFGGQNSAVVFRRWEP